MLPSDALLALIVGAAFSVEAAIGFGATLITLSLGSLILPTEVVLYRVVPLNLALSAVITLRARRSVDFRALATRILPAIASGLPVGLLALRLLTPPQLTRSLGAFVVALAGVEIVAMARGARQGLQDRPPLPRAAAVALLFLGGVAHGALASGGPPVVYVGARTLPDKTTFRATLTALWLLLNAALVAVYAARSDVTLATLRDGLPLVPGLLAGLLTGERLHGRVPERAFRTVVFVMLLLVGVVLGLRA